MLSILLLIFFFWVPSFCSVIQFDEQSKPYISARYLALRINSHIFENTKNISNIISSQKYSNKTPDISLYPQKLLKYLTIPKHDGQLWLMLNKVLNKNEKQTWPS